MRRFYFLSNRLVNMISRKNYAVMTAVFILTLATDSCVERINLSLSDSELPLVVDGGITNEPGPYQVKLSRAAKVGGDLTVLKSILAKQVTIFDDQGNSEILQSVGDGVYQTSAFQGVTGRQYFIRIETRDGKVYESIPEVIRPSGSVENVYYEFVSIQPDNAPTKYGFRIYADFSGYPQGENLFRWRFTGTFRVQTHPEARTVPAGEGRVPDPPVCSGWVYSRFAGLNQVGSCGCCECWPSSLTEQLPLLSDNAVASNGQFKKIEIGYVPLDYWTMFDKTMVTAKQLSISPTEFNYWKIVDQQSTGGTSLFQPATGKAKSNLFIKNGSEEVLGYFTVAGVSKKVIFIDRTSVPQGYQGEIPTTLEVPVNESCLVAFKNSSTQQPADWK